MERAWDKSHAFILIILEFCSPPKLCVLDLIMGTSMNSSLFNHLDAKYSDWFLFYCFFKSFSFVGFTNFTIFLYYVFKVLLSLLVWNLGDMFLIWKVTWKFDKNIYLSTLQKFEEPMLTQMHDFTNGDDDKMIHLL